jgi:hypothetical protein
MFMRIKLVCCSILIMLCMNGCSTINSTKTIKTNITLKEAFEMSYTRAKKEWNDKASLIHLSSVDSMETNSTIGNLTNLGIDGKREKWNAIYQAPNNQRLIVSITAGEITKFMPTKGPYQEKAGLSIDTIKYDSDILLKQSINTFGLKPGLDWAFGYHYVLSGLDGVPSITVSGSDNDFLFSKIYYNPFSGKLIKAEHQVTIGGKIFKSNFNSINEQSISDNFHVVGMDVSPPYLSSKSLIVTWGIHTNKRQKYVFLSKDQGASWEPINVPNDDTLKVWFMLDKSINQMLIFVINKKSLLKSKDFGKTWETMYTSNKQLLDAEFNIDKIAIVEDNKISLSLDYGKKWDIMPLEDKISDLQINIQGDIVIQTQKGIFLKKGNGNLKVSEQTGKYALYENGVVYADGQNLIFEDMLKSKDKKVFSSMVDIQNFYSGSHGELFILDKNNQIFELSQGGGDFRLLKIPGPDSSKIAAILVDGNRNKYFYETPESLWVSWKGDNNS